MQLAQPTDPLPWNIAPADALEDLSSLWDTPTELWNLAANMPPPAGGQTGDPGVIPLGSVGSGTANFLDDLPAVVQPKRPNSKEDRKLAVSREAQKRFRQRQKAKQRNIETELNDTKAELQEIKLRQQELEERNRLLEKVADLSKSNSMEDDAQSPIQNACVFRNQGVKEQNPKLSITVRGPGQSLTVATISQMSPADFSSLWTAYVQKMRVCLEEVDGGQDDAADQALAKLVIEASSVICCLTHFNTETVKALHGLMLDTGQPVQHPPGDAFYSNLVNAAKLSERQVRDLLYLWRMCTTRRGQLANERKSKLTAIPAECFSDVQMPNASDNVTNLMDMAQFIKQNGMEDFKVYSDTMCAIYRGVLTSKQLARLNVRSYPYLIDTEYMLEALARERGEPSQQQILAAAHSVDTKMHWANMRIYHAQLEDSSVHQYVPFKDSVGVENSSGSEGTTAVTPVELDTATWYLRKQAPNFHMKFT
ncbi:hypothetical protein ABBQ32_007048 [Trebouxia sp. C0010 RCD-2024]